MSYQIRNSGAQVVLVYPTLLETARKASKAAGLPENRLFLFSDVENESVGTTKDWRSMLGSSEEASGYNWPRLTSSASKKQIATINYSSGTTGLPKGVMITHSNLIANVEQSTFSKCVEKEEYKRTGTYEYVQKERWLGFLPLYHVFGQLNAILMACRLSVPVYMMTAFVFEDLLRVIQAHQITHLAVAPPILVMMSKHPSISKYDLTSLRNVTCGAAPLSPSLQNECSSRFKFRIGQGWGMTEMTCGGMIVPEGLDDDTGSVGTLIPNCEARLVDEAGEEVATGERGEIQVRGPNVSPGYWKNEKATRESMLEHGWLRTGDVAISNEKCWFWIVDRLKVSFLRVVHCPPAVHIHFNPTTSHTSSPIFLHSHHHPCSHPTNIPSSTQELIKVSGLQVAPAELEAVLLTHPSIADAGVVGVRAQSTFDTQEKPRAYIVLKENKNASAEEIQTWMKSKVAKHKFLTGGVVFVGQVPKSAAGKIQRKVLREWAKRDAGGVGRPRL